MSKLRTNYPRIAGDLPSAETRRQFERRATMVCSDARAALVKLERYDDTDDGCRIATHCLYPSFTPVHVYVAKVGEGYRVHDAAGAFDAAWLHGRDNKMIGHALHEARKRFHLELSKNALVASIKSIDWLPSAILSVANASALAAWHWDA